MSNVHGYQDLFVETSIALGRGGALDLSERVSTPPYLTSCRGIALTNGRFFYYCRLSSSDLSALDPLVEGEELHIVATTWDEVWRNYPNRNEVFVTGVMRTSDMDGETIESQWSVPLSQVAHGERSVDGIARPPGVFADNAPVPEFPFIENET